MAKPAGQISLDRFQYREPRSAILGTCSCGCREQIEAGYERIEWDDRYFIDRSHVINYLIKHDGLVEV